MKKILIGVVVVIVLIVVIAAASSGGQSGPKVEAIATPTAAAGTQAKAQPVAETKPTSVPAATGVPAPAATKAPAPPATPKAPDHGTVGQKVTSAGVGLSVVNVKRTSDSGNQFIKPKEGNEYLIVEVVIENEGRDKTPYNPMYFKVKDGEGFEYNVTMLMLDNDLKSGELAQGEKARGLVPFEIPKTAKGLTMSYQPIVILGGYQPIKFKLD